MEARTPKQKAKELISKFNNSYDEESKTYILYQNVEESKRCALIAVDEMQLVMTSLWKVAGIDEQHQSTYLEEVKKEIKKL